MEDLIPLGAGLVTIMSGIGAFFTKFSPFIIVKRSTYRNFLLSRDNSKLESIETPDGRKWIWRRETNEVNISKHGVSFADIVEARIESTRPAGLTPSELKTSYMTFRGISMYCCTYYEGEGYNRVFELLPPPTKRK